MKIAICLEPDVGRCQVQSAAVSHRVRPFAELRVDEEANSLAVSSRGGAEGIELPALGYRSLLTLETKHLLARF
jgi:hypothetical protein